MDILDQILAAEMANEYTDSQQLGRIEKKVYTFDGNKEGKPSLLGFFVKISNDTPDLTKVINFTFTENGEYFTFTKDMFTVGTTFFDEDSTVPIPCISVESQALIIIVEENATDIEKGLYVVCGGDSTYVTTITRIETETINQIDPKFIPGYCLPVVELTTSELTQGASLNDADCAALNACKGMPCIIKYNSAAQVFNYLSEDSTGIYMSMFATFVTDGSAWGIIEIS